MTYYYYMIQQQRSWALYQGNKGIFVIENKPDSHWIFSFSSNPYALLFSNMLILLTLVKESYLKPEINMILKALPGLTLCAVTFHSYRYKSWVELRIMFVLLEAYGNIVIRPMWTAARTKDYHIPSRLWQVSRSLQPVLPSSPSA